jgi:hypothetical protein
VRGKFNQWLSEVEYKHRNQMDKACHHINLPPSVMR